MSLRKRVAAEAITDIEVDVGLDEFKTEDLTEELVERNILSLSEADLLNAGTSLDDHYEDLYGSREAPGPKIDEQAFEAAEDALRRGDLAEAVVQIGRTCRQFAELPHLFARRA